ncbi:MAG: response regulator [Chitinophagaceae bacterium]
MNITTKSLLIVDDDPDDRNLFIAAAKEIDDTITCFSAENGQQALDFLNSSEGQLPDFIVLDLRMPRYSGKKCLVEIKSNERLKHIPVFIYTTSKNVEESNELKEIGACHFMTKPGNADEIYWLASFILGEQWSTHPAH